MLTEADFHLPLIYLEVDGISRHMYRGFCKKLLIMVTVITIAVERNRQTCLLFTVSTQDQTLLPIGNKEPQSIIIKNKCHLPY